MFLLSLNGYEIINIDDVFNDVTVKGLMIELNRINSASSSPSYLLLLAA